jgi:hypothetical protein
MVEGVTDDEGRTSILKSKHIGDIEFRVLPEAQGETPGGLA